MVVVIFKSMYFLLPSGEFRTLFSEKKRTDFVLSSRLIKNADRKYSSICIYLIFWDWTIETWYKNWFLERLWTVKRIKIIDKIELPEIVFSQVTFWFHNYLDKSKHKEIHQNNYSVTGNTSRMSSWAQIGKLLI